MAPVWPYPARVDWDLLGDTAGLRELQLNGFAFDGLGPLATLSVLSWLDLTGTKVTDLTPLSKFTALGRLWLPDGTMLDTPDDIFRSLNRPTT